MVLHWNTIFGLSDYRKQNHWAFSKTGVQEVGLEISSEESNQIIPSSAGFGTMHLSSAM